MSNLTDSIVGFTGGMKTPRIELYPLASGELPHQLEGFRSLRDEEGNRMIYWGYDPTFRKPSIHVVDCDSRRSEDITVSAVFYPRHSYLMTNYHEHRPNCSTYLMMVHHLRSQFRNSGTLQSSWPSLLLGRHSFWCGGVRPADGDLRDSIILT